MSDLVNSPAHYTRGTTEAIVVIEEAVVDAPDPVSGYHHGQALKYLLRLWNKDGALQDASKARWYLNRLIERLEDQASEESG
jgi:hypothetical protein